jgi:cysteine-rich repeat protein
MHVSDAAPFVRRLAAALLTVALAGPAAAQAQVCGDGIVTPPEQCDDGNLVPGDGCSPLCLVENLPPVCVDAVADVEELWPPNHALVPVGVRGVVDPDGDPVTVSVIAVAQDEPADDTGDGATCPDAVGLGADVVQLRAERQGSGDGRVYHVTFVASDPLGAACTGTVTVCVRHDQRPGGTCGDGGPIFDSFADVCGRAGPCDPALCIPTAEELFTLCEPLPGRVARKLTRARRLLARAENAVQPRRRARLERRAARLLARADAQAARRLDGACFAAVAAALDEARTCVAACTLPNPG